MRRPAGFASAVAVMVLVGGCGSTSPDLPAYRQQAALTLGTAVSEVATTRLVLQELADGDVFRPAAVTQLRYSEEALGSASQSFGSLNPPVPADGLHDRCSTALGMAEDLLADVRIAVHRQHARDYADLLDELDRLSARLEALVGRVDR